MPAQPQDTFPLHLGPRHLARVEGWGMAVHAYGYVYRPTDAEGIREVFTLARKTGKPVGLRGAGNSYGDAAINENGLVLDLRGMDRILAWDAASGVIDLEPGVTIERLWKKIITDGWWPPVVSGTMKTTAGGCAAMNIHGKNNYKVGPFGDHVLEFDLLTPNGEQLTCSRERNADLFHAAISGFGMLGCFTRIRMRMKKVHSGLLRVEAIATRNLDEMVEEFEDRVEAADYLVGWIDCTARGKGLGRGAMHAANYIQEGEDPRPTDSLTVGAQELPERLFGLMPRSLAYLMVRPLVNNPGVRLVNAVKYRAGRMLPRGYSYFQSHAEFAFLLDYLPDWKLAYGRGGLIQYQCFLPRERAVKTFEMILRRSQEHNLPPYLGVFKKHRPDAFLLTHALDGYSLALDYRVTAKNRARVWALAGESDRMVLDNGGRFYFAKDATLREASIARFFSREALEEFRRLKRRCDPEHLLQTNLSRRLFGEWFNGEKAGAGVETNPGDV